MNLETMKTTSQDLQIILSEIGKIAGFVKVAEAMLAQGVV